jgi:N4-gp56 family major capsid protein
VGSVRIRKEQRLSRKGVGPSGPKRAAPHRGDDIVWSCGKPQAARKGGHGIATHGEHKRDKAFFNQIAGNYEETDTRYTGSNAALTASGTPGLGNVLFHSGGTDEKSTTASMTASATGFGLTAIDACVELAQTRTYPIRPIRVGGGEYYVMFLHPKQFTALKTAVSTSAVTWYDVQRAAMEGGKMADNPIFTGAAGLYNNTLLHVAPRLPVGLGPDCSAGLSLYTAVFCGAQAAVAAFGRDNGPNTFSWTEEFFDYENQLGVAAGTIWGLKKTQYNGLDFGTIQVLSTLSTGLVA